MPPGNVTLPPPAPPGVSPPRNTPLPPLRSTASPRSSRAVPRVVQPTHHPKSRRAFAPVHAGAPLNLGS
ncbi:hypothetical protein BKD26_19195 [Streptomyces sp. CB03238]|nr:hypothetical protein BKD26_19195 [Streptomyces sp. CB03238]